MSKRVLVACLAALAFSSEADAITFFNTQIDVNAIAITSGPPGFDSQSGSASATPISVSVASVGTTDVATAGAIGGLGLLNASADVSASGGIANAVGTSHFSGSFIATALEPILTLDFSQLSFAVGSGTAATSLFVSLTSGGVTLFSGLVNGSGPWGFAHNLAPGATGLLDLTLSSEVTAGFPAQGSGNASAFGVVTVASAVPEPETNVLFLVGLAGVFAAARKRAARKA